MVLHGQGGYLPNAWPDMGWLFLARLAETLGQSVSAACVPTAVVASTIKAVTLIAIDKTAAMGLVSANVADLTAGVMKAMMMTKLRAVVAVLLVLGCLVTGATILTCRHAVGQDKKLTAEKSLDG